MAASSRSEVVALYKQMLRASQGFSSYNFREYALRKVRDGFKKHKAEADCEKIASFVEEAKRNLALIQRQGKSKYRCFGKYNEMNQYENLAFDQNTLKRLREDAIDWANINGVVMKNAEHMKLNNFAPFTLFPSPFPEYLFKEACDAEKHFHTLMQKASEDHEFLETSLQSVVVHDDFTRRLYNIYADVRQEGIKQPICLDFIRSDYMLDDNRKTHVNGFHNGGSRKPIRPYEVKQIEVNMIAASFGGLGERVTKLHRQIADTMGDNCPFTRESIPENNTMSHLGKALADAWKLYDNNDAVVMFVVQEGEANRYDQRFLQYSFQEKVKEHVPKKHVPVIFKSLQEINATGKLTKDHRLLINDVEVAVAYFRAGYTPTDYPTEDCWSARMLIEKSIVIKSPNIASHLVGSKKIQQVFSKPGTVERFIKDPDVVRTIRDTFAGLYSLDVGEEGDRAVEMALTDPERFVLKPQREGGGNNFYGQELVSVLNAIKDTDERSQYILMERIRPPPYKNYIMHVNFERPQLHDVVNELGIFGYILRNGNDVLFNDTVGYLVRTKSTEHADGGVAAGRSVLDSVSLI
eukprot:gene10693-11830_t